MALRIPAIAVGSLLSGFLAMPGAMAEPTGPSRAYFNDAPQCVVVLPSFTQIGIVAGGDIAAALARQLSGRFARVIHPHERRRLARAMAVDLDHPGDVRQFAASTKCPALLRWQVLNEGNDNAIVWSQKYLSIAAEITRARDGALLWQANAVASRNSGDPPLSLFSLPIAVLRAAAFQGDADTVASMLDDLARRLLASLPDLR